MEIAVCLIVAFLLERWLRGYAGPVSERYAAARERVSVNIAKGGQSTPWGRRAATIARGAGHLGRVFTGAGLVAFGAALGRLIPRRRPARTGTGADPVPAGSPTPPPPPLPGLTSAPGPIPPPMPGGSTPDPTPTPAPDPYADAVVVDAVAVTPDPPAPMPAITLAAPTGAAAISSGSQAMSLYEAAKVSIIDAGVSCRRSQSAADNAYRALADAKMPDHLRGEALAALDLLVAAEHRLGNIIAEMITRHDPVQEAIAAAGTTGSTEGMGGSTGS